MVVFIFWPLRNTLSSVVPPMPLVTKRYSKACGSLTSLSSTPTTTSPATSPALAAGPFGVHLGDQRAVTASASPSDLAMSGVTGCSGGAEPGPLHRAALDRRLNDEPHHVGRNRKSDAVRAAAPREDRSVDADEPAVHVDQRAARIAGIDGGVGLDEELIVGDADLRAGQRRDDAARHRLADAERIADGEHEIADFEAVGVAELDGRELNALGVEAQHGKIGLLVLEHDLGRELAPV